MIQTYHTQNKIQKYGEAIFRYFNPKDCGLEIYHPKLSRFRIAMASMWIGICIITPFTAWTIPTTIRWMVK